jgi:hypothetical protein
MAKRKRSKKATISKKNVVKKATAKKVKSKKAVLKRKPKPQASTSNQFVGSIKGFVGRHGGFRAPHSALRETLALYGIGVGDIKNRAKQLERVIQDIRNQDFLKNPSIQRLMKKVQKDPEAREPKVEAPVIASPKPLATAVEQAKDDFFRRQVLSDESKKELSTSLVKSIISRVDEFRKSMTPSVPALKMLRSRKNKKKT